MKYITLTILIIIISAFSLQAQNKSCCDETSAPKTMAGFSNDENFRNAHPTPLKFTIINELGKMVTYNTPDGKTANGYEIRQSTLSNKWLFVFHEWYGLNDYIKKESDELFSTLGNVNILAIDLYDGKVASNNDEASKYVQSVDVSRALNIIKGAMEYCGAEATFGTIGWCFGGSWSNQASIILEDRCKASVIFYGMPESDMERLKKISAPVLGIFAGQDKWITPEVAEKFKDNMKSLNKSIEIKIYDAVHGFANPSNPKHDPEATKDSKELALNFLKKNL